MGSRFPRDRSESLRRKSFQPIKMPEKEDNDKEREEEPPPQKPKTTTEMEEQMRMMARMAIEEFLTTDKFSKTIQQSIAPLEERLTTIDTNIKQAKDDHLDLLQLLSEDNSRERVKIMATKKLQEVRGIKGKDKEEERREVRDPFTEYREPEDLPSSSGSSPGRNTSYKNSSFVLPPALSGNRGRGGTKDDDELSDLGLGKVHISEGGKKYYDDLNRFTRKSTLKPSDIGTFDGTTSELYGFIKKIEDTVATSGVDERDIVSMLPRCLTEIASSWYNGLEMEDKKKMLASVEGFILALKEEYPAQTRTQKKEAIAYAYDPSVHNDIREYYYKKIELLRASEPDISEVDIIQEVYLGLEKGAPGIAASVTVTSFDSLSDFKTELFFKATSYAHIMEMLKAKKKEKAQGKKVKTGTKTEEKRMFVRKKDLKPSQIPGGRPCRECEGDHFDNACPSRQKDQKEKKDGKKEEEKGKGKRKVYMVMDEDSAEEESTTEFSEQDSSDDDEFILIKNYLGSYFSNSPFVGSRTVSTSDVEISTLPRRETVGTGTDFLTAHPLPIEFFMEAEGEELQKESSTVRGCLDTGGQCLIGRKMLDRLPNAKLYSHTRETQPTFTGVGGGKDKPKEFTVIELFFPNSAALLGGDVKGRRVTQITAEFQVVEELDCNVLLGRELLRGHGIRIIEDLDVIAFPDGNTTPIINADPRIRPPKKVYAAKGRYLKPLEEVTIEIRDPGMNSKVCLVTEPVMVDRRDRVIGGCTPRSVIRGNQKFIRFKNFSQRPIRIAKGEPLATVTPTGIATCVEIGDDDTMTVRNHLLRLKDDEKLGGWASETLEMLEEEISPATVGKWDKLSGRSREAGEVSPAPPSRSDSHTSQICLNISEETLLEKDVANLGLEDEFPNDEKDMALLEIPEEKRPSGNLEFSRLLVRINPRIDTDAVKDVIMRNINVFGFEGKRLGQVERQMTIEATDIPPSQPPYKESPRVKKIIDDAFAMLIEHGIIEKSDSPTASPVVCVKQHGKYRFCVDFRKLNDYTPPIKYPIPRPDSVFNALGGNRFFTTVDANKGYHQFGIHPDSRKLTAFTTESKGLWQYTRVPFGLKNAPSFFQKAMDEILGSMRWDFVLAYIDDVIIYSTSFVEHLGHMDRVLEALRHVGMTIDERKCFFAYETLNLLGHRINRLGLMTQPEKVKAIQAIPFPKTVKAMQRVLGQFTYYRQFIAGFALIAKPLYDAIKVDSLPEGEKEDPKQRARRQGRQVVEETAERIIALQSLKDALSNAPVLRHPDFEKPFVLHTDGCKRGLAATLEQEEEGKRHPILYISRSLKEEETRYTATEIECLGVYWALHKLAPYVEGSSITLITDHSALKWIWSVAPSTNSRLHRWSLLLGPLKDKVKIEHRAGRLHSNVDPISRDPLAETYAIMDPNRKDHSRSYHSSLISVMATADFVERYREACAGEDAVIMEKLEKKDDLYFKEKNGAYRLWVPAKMRPEVMQYMHDKAGHPGFLRTYVSLRGSFWWTGFKGYVEEYVRTCHRCQMEKIRTKRPPGDMQPILSPSTPFHTISIDFVEKLPPVRGMSRIASVTCKFTKAVCLIACPSKMSGEGFADLFLTNVYPRWGMPMKIVSDRDPRFTGDFWNAFTSLVHTKLGMTAAAHAQADGQSEKTNQTMEIMLRCYIFDLMDRREEADWTRLLPVVEFEHNMSVNVSTGFAPFDLLYAVSPRRPIERALLQLKRDEAPVKSANQLVDELEKRRKSARRAISKAQAFQKKYYDQKRSPVPVFKPGEKVVLLPYEKAGKLDPHGRCVRVRHQISPLAYRITVPDGSRMHDVVSIDYLRKYYRRGHDAEDPVEWSDASENEGVIGDEEVEMVVGQRVGDEGMEYLVRWKEFADKESSWVKASGMSAAMGAISDFRKKMEELERA